MTRVVVFVASCHYIIADVSVNADTQGNVSALPSPEAGTKVLPFTFATQSRSVSLLIEPVTFQSLTPRLLTNLGSKSLLLQFLFPQVLLNLCGLALGCI